MFKGLNAILVDGYGAKINVAEDISGSEVALLLGDQRVDFAPYPNKISEKSKFKILAEGDAPSHSNDTENSRDISADILCYANKLTDWSLSGGETLQFEVVQRDTALHLEYPYVVQVDIGSSPVFFCAQIATHRAAAKLIVTAKNLKTGKEHQQSVAFDADYIGGTTAASYQDVRIELPCEPGLFDVGFSISYLRCLKPSAEHAPFLFVAEPHLATKGLDAYEFIFGDETDLGGTWYTADYPDTYAPTGLFRLQYAQETYSYLNADLKREEDFFDETYYLKTNPDLDLANITAFEHYATQGWREERNPNPEFNVKEYMFRNPDVDALDIDPLLHYSRIGQNQGRSIGSIDEIMQGIWRNSGRTIPNLDENTVFERAQDHMLPMDIIDTRRLIVLVVPEHNAMSGGIFSFFSIANQLRKTRHIHGYDVIIMTRPNPKNTTYIRNSAFRNSETVYRFEQLRLFRNVEDLQLHIPEYASVEFTRSLSRDMLNYLMHRKELHVNILNQNIRLMPSADKFNDLRKIATSIGQSVAHHAYAGPEFAEKYNLPTVLVPAYTDLTPYPASTFAEKDNLIIYSDDDAPYRADVMRQLEEMGDYELVKIHDITFDRYMELATRCRFSVTFGEGFDGYVAQPIYQGGIGFALYTDEFFPNEKFKKYENFFTSEEEMIAQIVPTIKRLEANKKRYVALNKALQGEWNALYSLDDYVARILMLVNKDYEDYPSGG